MVQTRRQYREFVGSADPREATKGARTTKGVETGGPYVPIGQSVFSTIWELDPASASRKSACLGLTAIGILLMPLLPDFLVYATGTPPSASSSSSSFLGAAAAALQLPAETIIGHFHFATAAYAALFLVSSTGVCWPLAWRTEHTKANTACYDEMFCEPRSAGLVGRWGNTLSNLFYLVAGRIVVSSVWVGGGAFALPDALFGAVLLLLSFFSTTWHTSNYAKVHYMDLWAMDHAIIYLILRYLMVGMRLMLQRSGAAWAEMVPAALFVVYAAMLLSALRQAWAESTGPGRFDLGFSLSGRRRLQQLDSSGNPDMTIGGFCLFLGIAIVYLAVPSTAVLYAGRMGSPVALFATCTSLAIGWTSRMLERFCLDGFAPMTAINRRLAEHPPNAVSVLLRLAGAALSPTAWLHWWTGITLIAGFVHVRSFDHDIADLVARLGA